MSLTAGVLRCLLVCEQRYVELAVRISEFCFASPAVNDRADVAKQGEDLALGEPNVVAFHAVGASTAMLQQYRSGL